VNEIEFLNLIARRRIEIQRACGPIRELEWDGGDPGEAFSDILDDCVSTARLVLEIGCGEGRMARAIARTGPLVVGVDLSPVALAEAARETDAPGVSFVQADARALPFADGAFDLVYSRSGPACACAEALSEASRVLAPGGTLVALEPGESHHIEAQEVFGRGRGWPPARPVRFGIPEKLSSAGLELSSFAEYYGTGYYPDLAEFVRVLGATATIPDFDIDADAALIRELGRKLTTPRGIRGTEHAAVFAAHKADSA